MNDKISWAIALRDAPSTNISAHSFQVYDNGDLVFFDRNTENKYDTDACAAFGRSTWLWVSKA